MPPESRERQEATWVFPDDPFIYAPRRAARMKRQRNPEVAANTSPDAICSNRATGFIAEADNLTASMFVKYDTDGK